MAISTLQRGTAQVAPIDTGLSSYPGPGDSDEGRAGPGPSSPSPSRRSVHRLVRGPAGDPVWARPALLLLLAVTAGLYLWDLGASGWANSFYSAAVQAGTKSWKAFFFGSSDSSNFITVDKPPAALWVMEISARIFGLSSWSILVPQALEGVAAVAVLYATVRRWASAGAGLVAGTVMALTPVAALMFRFNNPDALLVLLLCGAAFATTLAIEKSSTRWIVFAFALVGLGFITKMMQAFLVVPGMAAAYFWAAPVPLARRVRQLAAAGVAMLVSAGWWVAAVVLTPAADRPYVGGSQDNNILNLIFGYNGFGRLTGNESGSVVGGGAQGTSGQWGPTGLTRLFGTEMGSQISWLLPAALVLLAVVLVATWRQPRTSRTRASMVLWGGWLLVTGLVFSLAQGIIHPYYTVALAPAIGAIVGIGSWFLWSRRGAFWARLAMGSVVVGTAVWGAVLLDRVPAWHPWLRTAILVTGCVAGALFVVFPYHERGLSARATRPVVAGLAGIAGIAVLAGPFAYTLATVATPHSGAIPSAGPASAALTGFPGGGPGGGFGGGAAPGRARSGVRPTGGPAGTGGTGGPGGGFSPGGAGGFGLFPGGSAANQGSSGQGSSGTSGRAGQTGPAAGGGSSPGATNNLGRAGGGIGGLLNSSTPSAAITAALKADASGFTWVAAVVGSNEASGYQLAAREPVMAIGGFNGTDPAPTLAEFEHYVQEKKIHYFIATGSGFGGSSGGGSDDASLITSWVESHFTASTIGGVTVYDLSAGTR
jgi:4-amino-4-deoxy-L-arabinose transferase-like glycosyltransferase